MKRVLIILWVFILTLSGCQKKSNDNTIKIPKSFTDSLMGSWYLEKETDVHAVARFWIYPTNDTPSIVDTIFTKFDTSNLDSSFFMIFCDCHYSSIFGGSDNSVFGVGMKFSFDCSRPPTIHATYQNLPWKIDSNIRKLVYVHDPNIELYVTNLTTDSLVLRSEKQYLNWGYENAGNIYYHFFRGNNINPR